MNETWNGSGELGIVRKRGLNKYRWKINYLCDYYYYCRSMETTKGHRARFMHINLIK